MPKANGVPKKPQYWHTEAIKDYCDGERLRDIEDKYNCHCGTVVSLAIAMGITPRPTGFASYKIAHKWVLQARLDFERLNGTRTAIKQNREQTQAAIST